MQVHLYGGDESGKVTIMKVELFKLDDVPLEGARVFPFFGREVQAWRVGGQVRVAANVCLHFGGPLECRDGAFICPWHGAKFDMATGKHLDGPGPKDGRLMFIATRVEGDAVCYVWGE
jgi:nitrite reductase/ring-hydroxylating ferredoxin subunit